MKKNTAKKMLSICFAATLASTALAGCGGKKKDGEQYLEVYVLHKGYGISWVEPLLDAFKQQAWVQEKYPELEVDWDSDDSNATAFNKMAHGENYNTTDIIFGEALETFSGAKSGKIANLTESVYNSAVPGENGITVGEKMIDGIRENSKYGVESWEENVYYVYPYRAGTSGIIYNATLLNNLDLEVPLTTTQFVETLEAVSNTNNNIYSEGYAIAENAKDGYWAKQFNVWWAQYSGINQFSDFYYGLVGNTQSPDVFKDTGRLKSLEVFESIFRPNKVEGDYKYDASKATYRYIYPYANEASTDYMVAQNGFLAGKGIFHANGDWFETEMHTYREGFKQQGYDYEFKFMRTPIISSIIETLPENSVADDMELRALVKAIDAGNTALEGTGYSVEQADYDRVKAARCIVVNSGGTAIIPSYASAKGVAIDLLRFMATDVAQEAMIKSSYGLTLPFKYNMNDNPALNSYIADTHKSKLEIFASTTLPMVALPSSSQFPYDITEFYHYDMEVTTLEALFSAGKKTAVGIYNEEIDYWKTMGTKWQQMISGGNV